MVCDELIEELLGHAAIIGQGEPVATLLPVNLPTLWVAPSPMVPVGRTKGASD
jgi:hypothetical protein